MKKKKLHILRAALGWLAETSARGAALGILVALGVIVTLVMTASLTALPAMAAASQDTAAPTPQKPLRVALLLDQASGDHGPTDNLLRGLAKAKAELGIVGDVIPLPAVGRDAPAEAQEQQEQGFKRAASSYDLIVAGSPALHELLMNHAGNYRRARFIAVDGMVKAPNIASVTFLDTQAAFLAGAAAATLTTRTAMAGINSQRVLGWVGDYDTPSRRAEAEAFLQGARLVHPETRVLTAFTESTTEDAGYRFAKELYAKGADIVAHHAGRAGLGVLRAAKEAQGFAIGHTQNQAEAMPDAAPVLLFSQVHRSDAAVFDMIQAAVQGHFPGGQEEVRHMGADGKEGDVGLSSLEPLRQRWGAAFPADLPQRLRELTFEIQRGGIQLPKVQRKTLCDCL